jgi:flagellar biosynthetic protein FliO
LGLASIAQTAQEVAAAEQVPGGYGEFLLTSLLVLVAVCVLAWVVLKFGLRRLYPGAKTGGAGPIKVVARLPLEPRQTLYIVEVGGKTMLLGSGDRPVSLLTELDAEAVERAVAAAPQPRSFADVLRRITGREPPDSPDSHETEEGASS